MKKYPIRSPFPRARQQTRGLKALKAFERGFDDFEFFVRYFFPEFFWGALSPVHESFCEREDDPTRRGVREVCAAPRGNAKTVFRTMAKTIHGIVYKYQPFQLILGFSAAEAQGKVKDIKDQLKTNERLLSVFGNGITPSGGTKQFTTKNGCRVVARGRGGQVRGLRYHEFRPTRVVGDDVESLEESKTPKQRAKTKEWFKKDVLPCVETNENYRGCLDIVGTVIHEDGLLEDLLKDPTWRRERFKSVIKESPRADLWAKWRAILVNLNDPQNLENARAYFEANQSEMLENVEVLWPDGEPYYNLQLLRVSIGEAAFSSEKQNEPFDPDSQILHPQYCPTFTVYWPGDDEWNTRQHPQLKGEQFAIVRHDDGRVVLASELKLVAFLDPAMGKNAQGDFNALVIVAQDLDRFAYVLEAWLDKTAPRVTIAEVWGACQNWGIAEVCLESVGAFGLMGELFDLSQSLHDDWPLKVVRVDQHTDKVGRIMRIEPWIENRWLLLNENINQELITQLKQFPMGHDDGPDALEGALSRLSRPVGRIIIQSGSYLQ